MALGFNVTGIIAALVYVLARYMAALWHCTWLYKGGRFVYNNSEIVIASMVVVEYTP